MTTTREEFYARCIGFVKANGRGFAILSKPEPQDAARNQQAANYWFDYLAWSGLDQTAKAWRFLLETGKALTVPCEKPEMFDFQYAPPRHVRPWNERPAHQPRGNVSAHVERARQAMRASMPKEDRKWKPVEEPLLSPQEWLDQQAANPAPVPVLSDSTRARLGILRDMVPDAA